ncbi:potassium channel family protein [Halalkalibacillus halophilus]|uniref:potassium channel family protein n=1 Tax=Halalkalibacillus halophilus TaxID=392827 RepID=UPI00040B4E59|nr:potassium channel family protein [Halalkalibacillus halophilus]
MIYRLWRSYFQIPIFIRLLATVLLLMTLFGYLIHLIEPNEFPNVFDGIWWAFITGATVGYGDFVPQSIPGRLFTILLILAGGGLLTFYMVTISSGTVKQEENFNKGKMDYHGAGHYILVGWNERTKNLIHLIQTKYEEKVTILLMDESLEKNPMNDRYVHFVKGDPAIDETWHRAAIKDAKKIIITSDQTKLEKDADIHSILLTITARGLHEDLPIFVEILTKNQLLNARRAGATEVICTNESTSTLLYHELTGNHVNRAFEYMMAILSEQHFQLLHVGDDFTGQSIESIVQTLIKKDKILVGIQRENEIIINPKAKMKVVKNDQLIILESIGQ